MKNTSLTKILAMGTVIPLLGGAAIYASTNVHTPTPTDINDSDISCLLKDSCSFAEVKKEILSDLKEEVSYTTNKEIKTQIEQAVKTLTSISDEDKFYTTLEKEYEAIDNLYEKHTEDEEFEGKDFNENTDELNLSKKDILEGIKEEVKELVQDQKVKNEVNAKIVVLNKMENQEKFFELLETTYTILDQYYEENNINIFDGNEQETIDINIQDLK